MKPTAEKIEVMQAYEEGKKIQSYFLEASNTVWMDEDNPTWNWCHFDYRIKQEKWTPPAGEWSFDFNNGKPFKSVSIDETSLLGIEYKTEQDAIRAQKDFKFYHWLWHLANELNEGWLPDWSDEFQRKYTIQINKNTFEVGNFTRKFLTPVFIDYETAVKAIEIMKQWDWYFGENHG